MPIRRPLVSVGLPVYNGENFIERAIESILGQRYDHIELIICDNASTDRTAQICEKYSAYDKRIRYFRQPKNLGAARNFNAAFEHARGEYFKWASHDDELAPDYLERCVGFLEAHPDHVMCWPHMNYIDESSVALRDQALPDLSLDHDRFVGRIRALFDFQIAGDDIIPSILALMRASALRNTRLWQRFTSSEEILMLELLIQGKSHQLAETGFHFRIHDDSAFHKNRTPDEREKWFDTEKHYVLQFPVWFLLAQYYVFVTHARLPLLEKIRCYYEIARRAVFLWRRYVGDLVKYFGQFLGYRIQYRKAG